MSYLFFSADPKKKFDADGAGTEGTLGDHLEYVNEGGTPDCWDSTDTSNRTFAINEAKESGLHLFIVDESNMRVVGRVNEPDATVK
jgi:hypothetical protein